MPIVKSQAYIRSYDDGTDVGRDLNTAVSDKYQFPFEFTEKLAKVMIDYP